MVEIRTAQMTDIPELVRAGQAMHEESRYARFDFDAEKYADLLGRIIPQGLSFVAEEDVKIIGAFIGYVGQHFFGKDVMSADVLTYVDPKHRGGWLGVKLIKRYLLMAEAMGVSDIHIGVSAGIADDRIGRLYERLGFRQIGSSYVKEN